MACHKEIPTQRRHASCCLFPGPTAIPPPRCTFPSLHRSRLPEGHKTDPQTPRGRPRSPPATPIHPPPNAARPGLPRPRAPAGQGPAAVADARPTPPLTAPPRVPPPPCPFPCPAAAGGGEAAPGTGAAPCAAGGDKRPGREEPAGIGNMAAASRAQVLRLYRALLRESQRFGGYNYRCLSLRPRGARGWKRRGGEEGEEEGAAQRCAHVLSLGGAERTRGCWSAGLRAPEPPLPGGDGRLKELLPHRISPQIWPGPAAALPGLGSLPKPATARCARARAQGVEHAVRCARPAMQVAVWSSFLLSVVICER